MAHRIITSFANIETFADLLDAKYGPIGTPDREELEARAAAFRTNALRLEARSQTRLARFRLNFTRQKATSQG